MVKWRNGLILKRSLLCGRWLIERRVRARIREETCVSFSVRIDGALD